jgi:hypothetical protein
MDICFIKPQDLLALSKAIFAWHFIKDKWPSRSEILNEYSIHRQEGTYWQEMKPDHDLTIHQHAQAGSQQKEKYNISETQSKRDIS